MEAAYLIHLQVLNYLEKVEALMTIEDCPTLRHKIYMAEAQFRVVMVENLQKD
jgi:hypothetical protein